MKVKLLADWGEFKKGQILYFEVDSDAQELIDAGTAEKYEAAAPTKSAPTVVSDPGETPNVREMVAEIVKSQFADQQKKAPPAHVGDEPMDKDPKKGFDNMGEFIIGIRHFAQNRDSAFRAKVISMISLREKAPTGLGELVDDDGGVLAPDEFRATLLSNTYDASAFWGKVFRIPISGQAVVIPAINETSRVDGSRSGGVVGYWEAEADAHTGSHPKFRGVRLAPKKCTVLIYGTDELLADAAVPIVPIINRVAGDELAYKQDDACINGTGAGMPLGILNAPCKVRVSKEGGQLPATVVYENVVKMWARCPARLRSKAVWYINQDVEPQLFTMAIVVGVGGVPVYLPASGASGTPYSTLFGRPVVPMEQCATLGTEGDIILAVPSEYIAAEKAGGIRTASSIHVRFLNDETVYKFQMRVDGQPWWNAPLTPAKGASTLSPFITLETRS